MPQGKHLNEKNAGKKWVTANIVTVVSLFAIITVSLFVFERSTESYIENRTLAEFPEFSFEAFFSGDYTDDISTWFNDTVPWRDGFKNISSNITKYMGVSLGGVKVYNAPVEIADTDDADNTDEPDVSTAGTVVSDPDAGSEPETSSTEAVTTTTEATTTTTTYDPRNEIAPGVITNGQVVCYLNGHYWGISLYSGGYNRDSFIEYINAFADDLEGFAQVYVMTPATSSEYYLPFNLNSYNVSQAEYVQYMADGFNDNVINVDCISVLAQHVNEDIYLRTDHHWQPLGAYYAAQTFAQAAGVDFADLSTFEKVEIEGYVGTMYTFTQDADLLNDPEVFTYYKPSNEYTCYYYDTSYNYVSQMPLFLDMPVSSSYSIFMGGDEKIVRIETDVSNGRKLAVFKDSYGNAEIPFYVNSFEEIYVCDIRYFDINAIDFLKENGVTDVLFSMCTMSTTGPNCEYIEQIRTQ